LEFKGYNEADQGQYHKKMQALFKKQHAFMSWTLYDSSSSKSSSWEVALAKIRQKKFGFIDVKRKEKTILLYIH
jgi:hypothetical protein